MKNKTIIFIILMLGNCFLLFAGRTALHEAVEANNFEAILYHLQNSTIDINETTDHGETALHIAARMEHHDIFSLLVANDADVNVRASDGWTVLHECAGKGYAEHSDQLIIRDADVKARTSDTRTTPLHESALYGHLSVTKRLIQASADVDSKDAYGETPLHLAAKYFRGRHVEFLLAQGADPRIENEDRDTPIDVINNDPENEESKNAQICKVILTSHTPTPMEE